MSPENEGPPATKRWSWTEARASLGPTGTLPLLILIGLASVQSFDLNAFGVLSPDIKHTFGMSQAGIDVVASLTGAVPIVFAVWLGFLGDRGNRIRLSRYMGLLWGITAVLTGLSPIVLILILARTVGGVGLLSTETIYPSLISDYYPPEGLGTAFGAYRFGSVGIGLLGAPLAGVLASVVGWRPAFVILAVPTFAFVACLSLLKEPARGASTLLTSTAEPPSLTEGFRTVRAIRTLRRNWLSAFIFGAGTVPFATVANNYFKDVFHLGDTARGGVSFLLGIGALIGVAIGGVLTSRALQQTRVDRLPVITGTLILSFGGLSILLAVAPDLPVALAISAFVTVGAFGFLPAYTSMVSLVAPPKVRSQAYGWSLLFYALGAIVISPVTGAVADAHGQRPSIAVLGLIVAAGGAVNLTIRRFVVADAAAALVATEAVHSDAMLSVRGVNAGYGGVQVLFGVDFEVAAGEIVALLGTNGAGKSTVLKTITGLLDPSAGVITFDGRDITHADPAAAARMGIAQVPGGRGVFPTLTVSENLRMAGWLDRKDKRRVDDAIAEALRHFPRLTERMSTPAGSLSGGEQQMLSLAQAFIARPRLLLIDELSLGLAPAVVKQLVGIVKAIHEGGTTVVVVEQSVTTALQLAERAVFMEKGEVRFSGPTADLLNRPDILRAVFLGGAASSERSLGEARQGAPVGGRDDIVLETRDLSVSYGGIKAVDGVGVALRRGEILGFLGANGAGKTTLFDLISGFTQPDRGHVILDGHDVTHWAPYQKATAGLGRSFQDARLWPGLTVHESLALALHAEAVMTGLLPALLGPPQLAASEAQLYEEVEQLVDLMGLRAFRDKFVSELSTGSRRMVELAAIVARRPKVILLDEPSSGIAQRETEALGPLIHRIRDELDCSIMIIEHDIPLISSVSDRMIAMELGQVIAEGPPDTVLTDPQVIESYLGGPLEEKAAPKRAQTRRRPAAATNGKAAPTNGTAATANGKKQTNGKTATNGSTRRRPQKDRT
jgi:ABC-type branched-subunit amino acid transport system ATPase component/predicted MFS family arabinose efflux permease